MRSYRRAKTPNSCTCPGENDIRSLLIEHTPGSSCGEGQCCFLVSSLPHRASNREILSQAETKGLGGAIEVYSGLAEPIGESVKDFIKTLVFTVLVPGTVTVYIPTACWGDVPSSCLAATMFSVFFQSHSERVSISGVLGISHSQGTGRPHRSILPKHWFLVGSIEWFGIPFMSQFCSFCSARAWFFLPG